MAKFDIKRVVSKGLTTDNGYESIPNGMYGYASNLRDATLGSEALERIRGTSVEFTVPDVVAQKKVVTITPVNTGRVDLSFYFGGSVQLFTISINTTMINQNETFEWFPGTVATADFTGVLSNVFVVSAAPNQGISVTLNASNSAINQYSDFTVLQQPHPGAPDIFEIITTAEALDSAIPGHTGGLKPIGSIELKNKLYVFSAISENLLGGYGEIGVYDLMSGTYLKLLGCLALNFTTRKQIDCDGETRDNVDYIYFTDNFNPVRSINSDA